MPDIVIDETKFESAFYYVIEAATGEKNPVESPNLTAYALDNFELYFAPLISSSDWPQGFSDKRIVWDYGDGTRSESVTGAHFYERPGVYTVRSFLYNNKGEAYENTYTASIEVFDFIEDKISLSVDKNTCDIEHLTGQIKNPIEIVQYNSNRTLQKNKVIPPIITYTEPITFDSNFDYFDTGLADQTYGHLIPSYSFIETISSVENIPISAIEGKNYDNIYVTVKDQKLVTSIEPINNDSFLAGASARNTIFFRSDIPGIYNLRFGFKQESIFSDFTNTTNYGVSAKICPNSSAANLSITSNGIDGEDILLDTFNINPVKFSGVDSAFVVKIKDEDGFSNRTLPLMEIAPEAGSDHLTIDLALTDGTTTYNATFYSDFNGLSSNLIPGFFNGYAGGFFKGYFNIETDEILENVWISASTEIDNQVVTGSSSKFTIYPQDHYVVAKQGEDVDFNDILKDVAIQPLFTDSKVLMKDFLGSIFGSIESAQDSVGKSTYEKIQNFTDNNAIIDYSNIDQLASILYTYKLPRVNKYSLPPKIKRLMDLLSISQSKLFGSINQNRDNFNSYGYLNSETYGKDRCKSIAADGVIFAGFDIVAFEKYSGTWTTLNTMLPLCASNSPEVKTWSIDPINNTNSISCFGEIECTPLETENDLTMLIESDSFSICVDGIYDTEGLFIPSTKYYRLSDYNSSWGWPLTPDKDGTIFDVYDFFYKTNYEKTDVENSVINFNDPNTTILKSYTNEEWTKSNGIMSNIFSNALYDGLGLMNK